MKRNDLIQEGRQLQDNFQKMYLKEGGAQDIYMYLSSTPENRFMDACHKYGYTPVMSWFAKENGYTPKDMEDIKSYRTPENLMMDNKELFYFAAKWHEKMIRQHQSSPSSSPYSKFIMKVGSAKGWATWLNFTKVESPKSGWVVTDANVDAARHAFHTGEITGMQPDLTTVGSGGSFGGGLKTMGGSMSQTGAGYGIAYLPQDVTSFKSVGCVIVFQAEYVKAYDVNTKQYVCIFDSESVETPIPIYDIKGQATIYGKKGSPIFQGSLNSAIKKSMANGISNYDMVGVKRGNIPTPDRDYGSFGF
jgi:hypothetical protein